MSSRQKVDFIINPIAGTKNKETFEAMIKAHLDHKKFAYDINFTKESGHAYELATKSVQEGVEYVIAVGGDGTVNETAKALIYEESALGIIPSGSGNGLARHLGIPLTPSLAIDIINQKEVKLIDAGKANNRPFFCTAGIGFDAHIGKLFSVSSKRGFYTYIKTVMKEFLYYKPLHYRVLADKQEIDKVAFSITFANAAQFGNNAYISPFADISDGKLDLCLIEKYPKRVGWHLGLRLFNKSIHKSRFMNIQKIDTAVVRCPEADCYHLDGEYLVLEDELKIETIPGCLHVLVPPL